ncbi:hypothetical protein ACLB2K_066598 [Fragaria x ananassa]
MEKNNTLKHTVSTCYVPSREEVAGRNEVEFLRGFHSVPAQVIALLGRDWGGPVFDSLMLKLNLCTLSLFPMWDSLPSFGVSPLLERVSSRLVGDCREVASQSALDWGPWLSCQSVHACLGTDTYVASPSALDWGPSRSGQSVRA